MTIDVTARIPIADPGGIVALPGLIYREALRSGKVVYGKDCFCFRSSARHRGVTWAVLPGTGIATRRNAAQGVVPPARLLLFSPLNY